MPNLEAESGAERCTEVVLGFVEELRHEYALSLHEFVKVQELLLVLAARHELPDDPALLEGWLRPILCSNRREQRAFGERYREYLQRQPGSKQPLESVKPPAAEPAALVGMGKVRRNAFALNAVILVFTFTVLSFAGLQIWRSGRPDSLGTASGGSAPKPEPLSGSVAVAGRSPLPIPTASQTPLDPSKRSAERSTPPARAAWDPTDLPAYVAASLLLLGFLFVVQSRWLRRTAEGFFSRTKDALDAESVLLRIQAAPAVSSAEARRAGARMRQRAPASIIELDLAASVDATARRAGLFWQVRRELSKVPEYLFLLDRRHAEDFESARADEVLDLISQDGTKLQRLYFDRDANITFTKDRKQRSRPLSSLEGAFHGHRVGLFVDPALLFDPLTGAYKQWLIQLLAWTTPVVFSSTNRDPRLPAIIRLAQVGVRVFEASAEGLAQAYGGRAAPQDDEVTDASFVAPLPSSLRGDARRWLQPDPPDPAELSRCLDEVRRYLGAAGYAWFSACAVFPQLRYRLALALSQKLEALAPRITSETRRRLASLPWMRAAHLPDWLRARLLADLSHDEREEVRRALESVLVAAADTGSSTSEIRHDPELMRAYYRALSRRWAVDPDQPSPLEDALYVGAMQDDLGVRLPRALRTASQAVARRARIALPPRDALQCAYGGLLLGYFSQLLGEKFRAPPLLSLCLALGALLVAGFSVPKPPLGRDSRISSFVAGVATGVLVVMAVLVGVALAHVDYGFDEASTSISNVVWTVQWLLALGFILAVFQRPAIRYAVIGFALAVNGVYLSGLSHIVWNLRIDWTAAIYKSSGPLTHIEALRLLLQVIPYAIGLASLATVIARWSWSPWQALQSTLRDFADRFALDRWLLDRTFARKLPASRVQTAFGAAGCGIVVATAASIEWAHEVVWARALAGVTALAFVAFPHLAALRYRPREGGWAVVRSAYEYAIITIVALVLAERTRTSLASVLHLSVSLPLVALISGLASALIGRKSSPALGQFLERAAPDRLLRTDPVLLGIGYLEVLLFSAAGLFFNARTAPSVEPKIQGNTATGGAAGSAFAASGTPSSGGVTANPDSTSTTAVGTSSGGYGNDSEYGQAGRPVLKSRRSPATFGGFGAGADSPAHAGGSPSAVSSASSGLTRETGTKSPQPTGSGVAPTTTGVAPASSKPALKEKSTAGTESTCVALCETVRSACVKQCGATGESDLDINGRSKAVELQAPIEAAPTPVAPNETPAPTCQERCSASHDECLRGCKKMKY